MAKSPPPVGKSRPKPRPAYKGQNDDNVTTKAGPSDTNKRDIRNDSEAEEIGMSEKSKGKRKARDDSDVENKERRAEKNGRRKGAQAEIAPRSRPVEAGSKPKKSDAGSRAGSKPASLPDDDDDAVDDDAAPKKKKRKINIFPTSQPTSFPWGELPQVGLTYQYRLLLSSVLVCVSGRWWLEYTD